MITKKENYVISWACDNVIYVRGNLPIKGILSFSDIAKLKGHTGAVTGILPFKDDKYLISWSKDGRVIFWNINASKSYDELDAKCGAILGGVADSDISRLYVYGGKKRAVCIDITERKIIHEFPKMKYFINGIALSKNGKYFAVYGGDKFNGNVTIYETKTFKPVGTYDELKSQVINLTFINGDKDIIFQLENNEYYTWRINDTSPNYLSK